MKKFTLKGARANVDLTQKEAADKIGVSVDTLGKWERGECYPSLKYIPAIESAYELTYDEIIFLH